MRRTDAEAKAVAARSREPVREVHSGGRRGEAATTKMRSRERRAVLLLYVNCTSEAAKARRYQLCCKQ